MSAELRRQIEDFSLDGSDSPELSFAARLARENGWTRMFANRVIREYKRFVYLAMTAGHPVCPSEQVDAAWHLHLTYTRSYWKRLCSEVLGQPLHHEPTKGGPDEAEKHRRMYAETLASYRTAFGQEPPADIWSPTELRFGDDIRHVVVNTRRNWIVPKAWVRRAAVGLAAAILCMTMASGCGKSMDPFALKGGDIFYFFLPLVGFAFVLGLVIRSVNKGGGFEEGEAPPDLGWEHAAYLSGGGQRLLSATLARLVEAGAVKVSHDGKNLEPQFDPPLTDLSTVERAVMLSLPLRGDDATGMKMLAEKVEAAWADETRSMQEDRLIFTSGQATAIGLLCALPLFAVLTGAGVTRLVVGLSQGKPSGYLIAAVIVGAIVTIGFAASRPFRTRRGDEVLARLKAENALLKDSKTWGDATNCAAMAVALFGTVSLASSGFADLHGWYPKESSGDGGWGGGCGSGCGGGGGCGGGCGGCG